MWRQEQVPAAGESVSSREVSWWPVYQLLAGHLGKQPTVIAGTPAWHELPDNHPDKWRAVLWAAVWWALDTDTRQEHLADAGKKIAEAVDANALAQNIIQGRGPAYVERRSA
ncbi:hypothetical protein MPHO_40560 [Mycolicibacterium phocaicum]|uniref:Uncharacterized protein n=1 Tax=Mycolicibacterium phocaicum TaxID=319706 RepID=A0A7I7ZV85_9MYCO|nr:hypothetical protein C1S79_25810 [Mycolicibacterium phocaicum]BBZ57064.1 hypothetical protein MPHO_40560 [Mycolicibacterium phocaicum]